MDVQVIRPGSVYHVGSIKGRPDGVVSYEGPCLSVSVCPEAWSRIAKLGGRHAFRIDTGTSAFIHVHGLAATVREAALAYAEEAGYVAVRQGWRAWFFDDESEEWRFAECDSAEVAEREVCAAADVDTLEEALDVFGGLGDGMASLVAKNALFRLTVAGMARCQGYPADCDALDAALIIWGEDVVQRAEPAVAGLWWDEDLDVDRLSAPRGCVFPSALSAFQATPVAFDELRDSHLTPEDGFVVETLSLTGAQPSISP